MADTRSTAVRHRTIVICPLAHEAKVIRRAVEREEETELIVSGPGPAAVREAVYRATAERGAHDGLLIILAGVGGGLAAVEDVPLIGTVIDASGRRLAAECPGEGHEQRRAVVLLGLDEIVPTPAMKREWHERTGASVVDMESHAFADACIARGVRWNVVRGISDGVDEVLPRQVMNWVDAKGRTRVVRSAFDIMTTRGLMKQVATLAKRSGRVLPKVGERVAVMARAWAAKNTA